MNLADLYSTLETIRRNGKGLLSAPGDTLNQWGSQIKEDLGKYDQGNARAMGLLSAGNPDAAAKAAIQNNMGISTGMGLLGLHIAYHGTPHTVDKFDLGKIGTGEGAQAYGHGLYFAGNPETAAYYRKALSAEATVNGQPLMKAGDMIGTTGDKQVDNLLHPYLLWGMPAEEAAKSAEASGQPALAAKVRALAPNIKTGSGGNLYKVDINADPAHYLDWDKPLSQQSPAATKVLSDFHKMNGGEGYAHPDGYAALGVGSTDQMTGADLYHWLVKNSGGPQDASALMKRYGIPGIKYKDAGSRAADGGTHNYVVFDDSLINNLGPQP